MEDQNWMRVVENTVPCINADLLTLHNLHHKGNVSFTYIVNPEVWVEFISH